MEENPPVDEARYESKKAQLKDLLDQLKELQDKIDANKKEKEEIEKRYNTDDSQRSD
jgi:chromosome segregation ATPase